MIMEDLLEKQEKDVAERLKNLSFFEENFRYPSLPKTLDSGMKRITKFINSLQSSTLDVNTLIEECLQLNLKQYLPETTKSILASKLGDN